MLLVPKVVLEYHQLDKVVKESLEVEATDSFDPTKRLQKDSPVKDDSKTGEKLETTASSMSSGATSTRKALKIEVESGSSDTLTKSDFAKKPFKDESNKKLDATSEFANDIAWKPVLKTDEIEKNRGMGAT